MAYEFTYVYNNANDIILMTNRDLVVLTAILIGGGGPGLQELDSRVRIPFKIDYDLNGIKAFATIELFKIFGTASKEILKLLLIVGIIKQLKTTEISLKGISTKTLEGFLSLEGIKAEDITSLTKLFGIKLLDDTKLFEIEQFNNIIGQINNNITLFDTVEGMKGFVGCLKIDTQGVKKILSKYEHEIKGKRDIRKIIISLMNIE